MIQKTHYDKTLSGVTSCGRSNHDSANEDISKVNCIDCLRAEIKKANAELKEERELLDRFYEFSLGVYDTAISHIISLNHQKSDYRSISRFEEAMNEYGKLKRVVEVAKENYRRSRYAAHGWRY